MHERDRSILTQMINLPELPASVTELYAKYEVAFHRVATGPLPIEVLLQIAIACDTVQVPKARVSPWDSVEPGTPVEILGAAGTVFGTGTFLRRETGLRDGHIIVAVYGDPDETRSVIEKLVRVAGTKPAPEPAPEPVGESEEPEQTISIPGPIDFDTLERGTPVWVEVDDQIETAKYVRLDNKPYFVRVKLDREKSNKHTVVHMSTVKQIPAELVSG